MDPATKDYIDSRDDVVEAHFSVDIARIHATLDSMRTTIEAQAKTSDSRMDRLEKSMGTLRTTMIVTGISVVLGVAGLNATILQNMQSSFESGRMVSASQAAIMRQVDQLDARVKEVDQKLRQIDALYDQIQKKVPPERPPGAR